VLLVAAGRGVALLPAGAARQLAIPGVTFRPLAGYAATTMGIAWRADETATAVLAFVAVVRAATHADVAKCEIEQTALPRVVGVGRERLETKRVSDESIRVFHK
jgi:LysR substrate binding domain